jgi:hypothetical protein
MPPGVPVAIPYEPQERMAPCAGAAGGWQTPRLGAAKGHDVRAATTATDAPGPTPPGTRHGGCVPQQSARPAQAAILASATPAGAMPSTRTSRGQCLHPDAIIGRYGGRPTRYAPGNTPMWLRKIGTHCSVF